VKNVDEAAAALRGVLEGDEGPMREISLLNAAAALVVAGAAVDLAGGLAKAASAVDSGRALQALKLLVQSTQTAAA
jgi:anthranilate phosphoribosyltransferase